MALVVEDGTGKSDAEAYISVAATETYLSDRGLNTTAWDALNDSDKEEALRNATEHLDAVYYHRWKGTKNDEDNALAWPRANADENDYAIDHDAIPTNLKRACARLALLASSETLLPDVSTPGPLKRKQIKAGAITIDKTWASAGGDTKSYRMAHALLTGLTVSGNRVVRA